MKKNHVIILFFIIFFLVLVFYLLNRRQENPISVSMVDQTITKSKNRMPPKGMREYINNTYRLSLFYPEELSVNEFFEGEGVSTIIFQNTNSGEGFQIFVLPYFESQVSAARFKKDVPSGVRADVKDINIDGVFGASFYSKDLILGDTYELWFIKNNYLYEITTHKSLEKWLDNIMLTWKFI